MMQSIGTSIYRLLRVNLKPRKRGNSQMTTNDLLKITRNNTYFPGPLSCNFALICLFTLNNMSKFTRQISNPPILYFMHRILQAKFTRKIWHVNVACKILCVKYCVDWSRVKFEMIRIKFDMSNFMRKNLRMKCQAWIQRNFEKMFADNG